MVIGESSQRLLRRYIKAAKVLAERKDAEKDALLAAKTATVNREEASNSLKNMVKKMKRESVLVFTTEAEMNAVVELKTLYKWKGAVDIQPLRMKGLKRTLTNTAKRARIQVNLRVFEVEERLM